MTISRIKFAAPGTPSPFPTVSKVGMVNPSGKPMVMVEAEKGSIGALGYIKLMRTALTREGRINAIRAYTGYNVKGDYGSQELAANMKAKQEITKIPTTEVRKTITVTGWVAGIPVPQEKLIKDLEGREIVVAAERDRHMAESRNITLTQGTRELHVGLAAFEHSRLLEIQDNLRRLSK